MILESKWVMKFNNWREYGRRWDRDAVKMDRISRWRSTSVYQGYISLRLVLFWNVLTGPTLDLLIFSLLIEWLHLLIQSLLTYLIFCLLLSTLVFSFLAFQFFYFSSCFYDWLSMIDTFICFLFTLYTYWWN